MARPCGCTKKHVELGLKYIDGGYRDQGEAVPTAQGLSIYLDVSRATPYNWSKQDDNKFKDDFAYIVDRVQAIQGMKIINGGLVGDYNPAFAGKLVGNHGFGERQEIDHKSSDGSMTPKVVERVIIDPSNTDA